MSEITLQFDKDASRSIDDLMKHYKVESRAALISKAIWMLKVAAYVGQTEGDLIARKDGHETKIIIR